MEIRKHRTPQRAAALLVSLLGLCALVGAATLANNRNHEQQQQQQAESNEITSVAARTSSGLLRGVKQLAPSGFVLKFLNVPYAEAPIGSLRFKRPVELKTERANDILNASKFGKTCPQFRHLTKFISPLLNIDTDHQTSEDCLQLNVFVPATVGPVAHDSQLLEPNKQLPVIVWIPGEGFDFADARQFDGSILALKTQSIVVTVQYRVGVLGFLRAPKLNVTGNMGVYDQIEALRWVRKNAAAFGGDPDRVTLMGRFTGSMSISAMISAPRGEQLLQLDGQPLANRVALLSGIAVDDWIIESEGQQQARVASLEQAAIERQYCTSAQVADGSCMGALTAEQLTRVAGYGWRLIRDNELIGERPPIEAIRANQLAGQLESVLIGETAMEGTICLYRHILEAHTNYAQLIDEDRLTASDLYEMIRYDSQTYFGLSPNKTSPIQMALESLIEGSSEPSSGGSAAAAAAEPESRLRDQYLNACSSYMVRSHSNRFKRNLLARNQLHEIRLDSSKRPVEVYHYELKYKPSFSLAPEYIRSAAHGDDIPLIFGLVYNQPRREINEADLLMTRKMMSYIGNFVHGNGPLPPTAASNARLAAGDNETVSMDDGETAAAPAADSAAAAYVRPRSWASEGQMHQIELDETDMLEISSAARRKSQQQQQQQHYLQLRTSTGSNSTTGDAAANAIADERSTVKLAGGDKSPVSIRLVILDGQQDIEQQQQQQLQLMASGSRGRQASARQQQQQSAPLMQQTTQPTSHQTNMTLVNESSFVTMLVFCTCLIIFALMSTCLVLCLVVFKSGASLVRAPGVAVEAAMQRQHYTNSSSSRCNIYDDTQGGIGGAAVGSGKDARGFGNVFAKLGNNTGSQSHHQPNQQQQQQFHVESQTSARKQLD